VALALEMGLDPEGDRAIRDLWSRLEQLGVASLKGNVPSIRPHLSLVVTDDADGLREHAPGLALRGHETDIEMAAVLADALAACLAFPLPVRARLRAAALTDSLTGATTPL
jgi:hypothetical protein